MGENEIIKLTEKTFEDIQHIDENGNEYWYARELMLALGYSSWDKFKSVIKKLKFLVKTLEVFQQSNFPYWENR